MSPKLQTFTRRYANDKRQPVGILPAISRDTRYGGA